MPEAGDYRKRFDDLEMFLRMARDELLDGENPQEAANWLGSLAINARDLYEALFDRAAKEAPDAN